MSTRERLGTIWVITDTEVSYEKIGDVEGGFDSTKLKEHIKNHGHVGLCELLTSMQFEVWQAVRELNGTYDGDNNLGSN